jgi:hypothetical protein
MAKQKGYPDRRGMGAESDFISEQFVPSEQYKEQLRAMAQTLAAVGLNPNKFDSLRDDSVRVTRQQESEPCMIPDEGLPRTRSMCDVLLGWRNRTRSFLGGLGL